MRAVGIDLGTTRSRVAVVDGDCTVLVRDSAGRADMPSVVGYDDAEGVVVGRLARAVASTRPLDTVFSIARYVGRGPDVSSAFGFPYRFRTSGGHMSMEAGGVSRQPAEIAAELFRALRHRVVVAYGEEVEHAVITVPAGFGDAQRRAVRNAARLAGFHVMRLLSAPAAVALAMGLHRDERPKTAAILDLGGGHFDVTLLRIGDGAIETLASAGDPDVAGEAFDRAIAAHLLHRAGVRVDAASPEVLRQALEIARRAKEALTDTFTVAIDLPTPDGIRRFHLGRDAFERIVAPLFDRVVPRCHRVLNDAGVRPWEIDALVLVGGCTRLPMFQRFIAGLFNRKPICDPRSDESGAHGAALLADRLVNVRFDPRGAPPLDAPLVLGATQAALGIVQEDGATRVVVDRGAPIPARKHVVVHVGVGRDTWQIVDGGWDDDEWLPVAEVHVAGGSGGVRLAFTVDADGILDVTAEGLDGEPRHVDLRPSFGLTDAEVEDRRSNLEP